MNARDAYADAQQIADAIEGQGHGVEAERIRSAISKGVSGTEIFMELRYYLAQLLNAANLDDETSRRIRTLHEVLDRALR